MDKEFGRILVHPELDDRDVRIVLLSIKLQLDGEFVTKRRLSEELGIGHSTVERHLKRLRDLGHLTLERIDPYVWYYDFSSLYDGSLRLVPPQPPQSCDTPQFELSALPPQSSDTPQHIYPENTDHDKVGTEEPPTSDIPEGEWEDDGVKIFGKDGLLKERLKSLPSSMVARSGPPPRPRIPAEKPISEYNCNDVGRLFYREWRSHGLKGNPTPLTIRDRGHLKEMIETQSPDDVVTYVKWVFDNWDSLLREYRLSGSPSIVLMYGYRRSWFYDAINGKAVGAKGSSGSEYSDGDIPTESWG